MRYAGQIEYAQARKIRQRNTALYRLAHWPIWIGVFFLLPGPLIFRLFARGFGGGNLAWLSVVLLGTGIAGFRGRLPGSEPRPYILRFDEDRPNPLYRRVCYTFAWNAVISFLLMNLVGLAIAVFNGGWYLQQLYRIGYPAVCTAVVLLGVLGRLPRAGESTRGEGTERRYFYGAVWTAAIAQTGLLLLWKLLPVTPAANATKLVVFAALLLGVGLAGLRGFLPRTRPIVAGEMIVAD